MNGRLFGLSLAALALVACDPEVRESGAGLEAGASPNASILPAPLATEVPDSFDGGAPEGGVPLGVPADSKGRLYFPDAGPPPPVVVRPDVAMPAEVPLVRDLAGVTLQGVWRWRDVPAPPKAAEVSTAGLKAAADLTELSWKIDLAESGRMRIDFTSRALPLPTHAELRSRLDRYGHIALWPNASEYRVAAPGALRPLLGERRVDVTALTLATATAQGAGRRNGLNVQKIELASNLGSVSLELAKAPEAGEGATLLCRALVEIAGIDPKAPACTAGELPLAATYSWRGGGGAAFEVTSMTRRADLAYNDMLVPPPGAAFAPAGLPASPGGVFLTREELSVFRTGPVSVEPNLDPRAPGEGFIAENHSDTLMYVLLDGVPVVAVPPDQERYLIGPQRGRYVLQWRTFFGDRIGPAETVELPARVSYGEVADAGAPPPDGG